uniref:hypothetical protein n=1 Tax=Sphingomonas populi TaxID=2484750 RepID=UPI0013EEDB00|nr:hypothetical protein [Sphingomonas populi]
MIGNHAGMAPLTHLFDNLAQDLEEQPGADWCERHVAEFGYDEQLHRRQIALKLRTGDYEENIVPVTDDSKWASVVCPGSAFNWCRRIFGVWSMEALNCGVRMSKLAPGAVGYLIFRSMSW